MSTLGSPSGGSSSGGGGTGFANMLSNMDTVQKNMLFGVSSLIIGTIILFSIASYLGSSAGADVLFSWLKIILVAANLLIGVWHTVVSLMLIMKDELTNRQIIFHYTAVFAALAIFDFAPIVMVPAIQAYSDFLNVTL